MSDYRDVVRKAIEEGFYLDSCGSPERYYSWGSWIDLCGMSIEDANAAPSQGGGGEDGGDTAKTKNTITFVMQKGGDGEYSLFLNVAQAPTDDVNVTFTMDGETRLATIPAGTTSVDTGFKGADASKPYAVIANPVISSNDEQYTYTTKNSVKTGIFTLTITKDGVKTTQQVKYGTPVTLDTPAEKEGYDFVWKDSAGNVITGDTFTMPEANASITGAYVAKEYTLTYTVREERLNGDTVSIETVSSQTAVIKYNTKIWNTIKDSTPTREGYALEGWTSEDGSVDSNTTMPAKDFEVTNTYKLNKYVIKFVADGNEVLSDELYFGQATTTPAIPDKTGYTTIGWDADVPATMPSTNITINAVYEAIIYYIRYNVDGVEKYADEHIYGDAISIRADESKEGYTFSGWDTELPATMPANDITVSGTFTINTYHFTLYVDGDVYFEKDYEYGEAIDKAEIADPTKEGYTFTGWEPEIPDTVPASDLEISAKFQINQYSVNYYVDDVLYTSVTLDYNAEIVPVAEPEKEGHTFSGWSNVPERVPASDVRIDGTFSANTYHFTLYVDGDVYFEKDYTYGEPIDKTEIEDPSKEGYTFTGWDPEIPDTVPATDMEINATFQVNTYALEYYVDGEPYFGKSVEYDSEIIPEEEPEKEGYTFSGWSEIPARMPAHDVRIGGTFTINDYLLTYYVDGDIYTSVTVQFADTVEPIEEPEKEGYTFSGWEGVPATMPAHDVDVNGTFIINTWEIRYFVDGEPYLTEEHDYGESIQIASDPDDRIGYTFSGWTYDAFPATMPDHDIEVFGEFIINQYTLSFFVDGSGYTSITADYATAVPAIEEPSAETGYHFEGWTDESGETVEVPATMPAYDMDFFGTIEINVHTASYYITDTAETRTLHSQVDFEYGAQITYPTVEVPEGYVLKWDKEYATMPDMDIDIEGKIEEFTESKTIYYGSVPVTGLSEFDNYQSLSTFEYENGVSTNVNFVIPGDPEWEEVQYYTNRKKNAWIAAHMYDFYFMAPESTSVEFANSLGPYDYYEIEGTVEIDGTVYKAYHADGQSPVVEDDSYAMIIKITKN